MGTFKRIVAAIAATVMFAALLNGCGKSKEMEAAEAAAAKMVEAAKKMEESVKSTKSDTPQTPQQAMKQGADALAAAASAMGALTGGGAGAVEPVDFRELQALLPETLGGMKRGDAKGEKVGAMGIKVSNAEATYSAGENRIKVKIVDTGSMSGVAGMAAWAMIDIDSENSAGYEKTSNVAGRKTYEKWMKDGKRGELNTIVASRFMIEIRGEGVEMKDLKQAAAALDYKKLEALKSAAPVAAASK
ncbi:MAG: hypothetical protein ABI583_14980 [Betaproteobacteria bacterium]